MASREPGIGFGDSTINICWFDLKLNNIQKFCLQFSPDAFVFYMAVLLNGNNAYMRKREVGEA